MGQLAVVMFGPSPGSWWIRSKTDPRWNRDGRATGISVMTRTAIGEDGKDAIQTAMDELRELYGEPPADLEFGAMKD